MHGDSHRRYIFSFPAFVRLFCVLRFLDLIENLCFWIFRSKSTFVFLDFEIN